MKEYIKQLIEQWCNRPILSVIVLAFVGIVLAVAFRREPTVSAEMVQRSSAMHRFQTQMVQKSTEDNKELISSDTIEVQTMIETDAETEAPITIDRLHLAYMFNQETEGESVNNSFVGKALHLLQEKDSEWFKNIYRSLDKSPLQMSKSVGRSQAAAMGRYNPNDESHDPNNPATWVIDEWSNVKGRFINGAGSNSTYSSNTKAILAMASIYSYLHPMTGEEELLEYVENLWKRSHNHSIAMGNVYYCSGCLGHNWEKPAPPPATEAPEVLALIPENWDHLESDARASLEAEIEEMKASVSQARPPADPWNYNCPGHVDLTVTVRVHGLDEKKGLFSKDNIGDNKNNYTEVWQGWTEENRQYARNLFDQDWNSEYGLSVSSTIMLGQPLTEEQIQEYMSMLPQDLAKDRVAFIRYGLDAVGKIPYYWGGKPSCEGYEGNHFGTPISADYKGRFLKGLDCSGLVNWIYWSVFHKVYPYDGTEGFVASGTPVQKEHLQPGDIGVLPGENSHAVIFLAWADENHTKMYAIHSTGKPLNTIVVNVVNGNWPYYRRVVE